MLTAERTDTKSRIRSLEIGADAFLTKPIDKAELAAQVNVMLRIKRAEKHLRRERDLMENFAKDKAESLEESESRYKIMFDNMDSGVVFIKAVNGGDDFIFTDFNRAAERIENIKKESLIGKSVLKVFPEIKDLGLFDVFRRVWATGNVVDLSKMP